MQKSLVQLAKGKKVYSEDEKTIEGIIAFYKRFSREVKKEKDKKKNGTWLTLIPKTK